MNAKQLRRFLDANGFTQNGAARALEIDPRTMRRYVAGDLHVPKVVELSLQWLGAERKRVSKS